MTTPNASEASIPPALKLAMQFPNLTEEELELFVRIQTIRKQNAELLNYLEEKYGPLPKNRAAK